MVAMLSIVSLFISEGIGFQSHVCYGNPTILSSDLTVFGNNFGQLIIISLLSHIADGLEKYASNFDKSSTCGKFTESWDGPWEKATPSPY